MNRDDHRKSLHREIDRRLKPRIRALGFESTRTKFGKAAWPGEAQKGWAYARRRSGNVDHLDIRWEKYGAPWFVIDFDTRRQGAEFGDESISLGELNALYAGPLRRVLRLRGRWFGRGHNAAVAVDMALSALDQMEAFFAGASPGDQLELTTRGGKQVRHRVPWLLWPIMVALWLIGLPIRFAGRVLTFLDPILMAGRGGSKRKAKAKGR
jgi:hypothetical protein